MHLRFLLSAPLLLIGARRLPLKQLSQHLWRPKSTFLPPLLLLIPPLGRIR